MRHIPSFFILLVIGTWVAITATQAMDPPKFPTPTGFVTDTTGTLGAETVRTLETRLRAYEQETGTEIAVAVIASTDGADIAEYATALGNAWGVGKKAAKNGILLVVALDDRELFIATGSQTEGELTDLEAQDIIRSVITPRFRSGDWDGGIAAGVDGIIAVLGGAELTDLRMSGGGPSANGWELAAFFAFVIVPWLGAILARSKSWWLGGVLGAGGGAILGAALIGPILAAAGLGLLFGALGLGLDYVVSREFVSATSSGRRPSWWIGGPGLGGGPIGGSSGGFGGFSGGGFSGGGSGGSW